MSKSKMILAAALLTGMVFAGQVGAAQIGQPLPPRPVEPEFGTYKAKVKQYYTRHLPGGWTSYYQIFDVTDITLYYCQAQVDTLMQGGNTVLLEPCHYVN